MRADLRPIVLLALATACSAGEATYACGPVGAYLLCDLDQACVEHRSPIATMPNLWTCEPDVGCATPQRDYCGVDSTSADCEQAAAEATDGSRPLVSIASCTYP
ncbi:MAG: hypothetical protein M3Y87_24100 [Myxococcota bacterium]|nr:hypothetical protein [Myxococcota bacterium]